MELTPDPHGQAALMLCEGLALLLIEEGIVHRDELVGVIEGVVEVKQEVAGVTEGVVISMASIGLLLGVARSIAAAPLPRAAMPVRRPPDILD